MKQPENMDAGEMTADRYDPTDEEVRRSVRHWLDEQPDFDAIAFVKSLLDVDPHLVAEALREYVRDSQ